MTKLPLPSPHSPSGLDEKILAYAKQQLPEKETYRPPLWLSGLATASVVAIAVIIAIPEQPRVSVPAVQPATASPHTAVNESADMEIAVQRRARKQSASLAASAAPYGEDEMAAADAAPILDSTIVHQQLREMAALVNRGDPEQAALDYQKLKELCPHCDLPVTVEEAIEKYLTDE